MLRRIGLVFRFTFKNQTGSSSFKRLTLVVALLLLAAPFAAFFILDKFSVEKKELKPCGADTIYVVNEANPDADYSMLNLLGKEGYKDLKYINSSSVDEALKLIEERQETKSLVLEFKVTEDEISNRIILPDNSSIENETAKELNNFLDESGQLVTIIASGISVQELSELGLKTKHDIFSTTGYNSNDSLLNDRKLLDQKMNSEILPVFDRALVYISVFVIYMMVLVYGTGIAQSVVMEKESKLMDTMLVSLEPGELITGKLLGIIGAAILQVLTWIASIAVGLMGGIAAIDKINPNADLAVIRFIKSFKELNLFRPRNLVIGILALLTGIILYAACSAITGAISGSREEVQSNQGTFTMLLVASFYLVIFFGFKDEVATWLYLVPFTSAMVLPAKICTGAVSFTVGLGGLLAMMAAAVVILIVAGKLYVMMSLYKGNSVKLSKAFKMLIGKA